VPGRLKSYPGAVAMRVLRPHGLDQLSERLCCAHAGLPSLLDRPPPRSRYPDPYNLDRLAASHHHLALCSCKPAPDETGEHPAVEAMAADKRLLVGAMAATGEQL
jgi:hypothetical protein